MPPTPAAATLIFAPGIGHNPHNTAENVAEVVARSLDRRRQGTYTTDPNTVPAPRGLRAARTVVGPKDERLLDVFELDYKHRLEDLDPDGAATTLPPSPRVAVWDSIVATVMMRHAWGSTSKRRNAKVQLFLGIGTTVVIIVVALAAVVTWIFSGGLFGWHPKVGRGVTFAVGAAVAGVWAKVRKPVLTLRLQMHRVLRYLRDERHQMTVTQSFDDAVDALLDARPKATVHVLGYSFGSLVAFDALFPKGGAPDRIGGAVRSLATVGFLHDAVTLYVPDHFTDRAPRVGEIPWRNVFIPSDVMGSNLMPNDDTCGGDTVVAGRAVASRRYTDEQPHWYDFLKARGFRMHGGYWDGPDAASCFDLLTDLWVP